MHPASRRVSDAPSRTSPARPTRAAPRLDASAWSASQDVSRAASQAAPRAWCDLGHLVACRAHCCFGRASGRSRRPPRHARKGRAGGVVAMGAGAEPAAASGCCCGSGVLIRGSRPARASLSPRCVRASQRTGEVAQPPGSPSVVSAIAEGEVHDGARRWRSSRPGSCRAQDTDLRRYRKGPRPWIRTRPPQPRHVPARRLRRASGS